MTKFLGYLDVVVDGVTILSGDDTTFDPGGVMREPQKTNRVIGFSERVEECKATINVGIDSSFSIDFYRNITNATLVFKADTGQVWTAGGAWCSTPPSISQKDGKAKVEFTGPPATEILA